jgi:hypothetical protein
MKKQQIGFFATLIVGGAAAYYFLVYLPSKNASNAQNLLYLQNKVWGEMTKKNAELIPYKTNYFGSDAFNNLALLTAWNAAIDSKSPTFYYGGTTYDTSTGIGR